MAARTARRVESGVFLNVPFDSGYERSFVALIACLIFLGRTPRCVLEITEKGQGRLRRILDLMEKCPASIHDLSRVGVPVRFNMPFELGLAHALSRYRRSHDILILEKVPHRVDRTLSDWAGRDPLIHRGLPQGVIAAVLSAFVTRSNSPHPVDTYRFHRKLWKVAEQLRKDYRQTTIFHRAIFLALVGAAVDIALSEGVIRP